MPLKEFTIEGLDLPLGNGRLLGIFDSCDAPLLLEQLKRIPPSFSTCLFRDSTDRNAIEGAPYLARVDYSLYEWLKRCAWNDPWGVFFVAPSGSLDLRRYRKHLRKFLIVRPPVGDPVYFRYYDPRVLPTFLRSCSEAELKQFFGPIEAFCVALGSGLVVFCIE